MPITLDSTATPPTDAEPATARQQPPESIWTLTNAVVPSTCLHLVAELGVADEIGEDPVSIDELASHYRANPDSLDRVLSLLAAHGIFRRDGRAYGHTEASRLLRSDDPVSMRAFARMMGLSVFSTVLSNLEHSVRTGAPAIELVEPSGYWAYLRDHPDEAQIFAHAMTAKGVADSSAVLGAYDFSRFNTIADIGGGRGHLLRAVLDAAPGAHGVLFDLPEVIQALDIKHERLTPHAGDFFNDPLPTANAYLLMDVLHDWADPECVAILTAIRRAGNAGARVLIIETVLSERGQDPRGHTLDVIMLAVTGGQERTAEELTELFRRAGLSGGAAIATTGPLCIFEGRVGEG
ncbi:MAG: methyltransferase [Solirubrobacteraceae bacterium]